MNLWDKIRVGSIVDIRIEHRGLTLNNTKVVNEINKPGYTIFLLEFKGKKLFGNEEFNYHGYEPKNDCGYLWINDDANTINKVISPVKDTKIARKLNPNFEEYKEGWILV